MSSESKSSEATNGMCIVRCKSVMGWNAWVTDVTESSVNGEQPIVSLINRIEKAKVFTRAQAEAILPKVHTTHPEAQIELAII